MTDFYAFITKIIPYIEFLPTEIPISNPELGLNSKFVIRYSLFAYFCLPKNWSHA